MVHIRECGGFDDVAAITHSSAAGDDANGARGGRIEVRPVRTARRENVFAVDE